MATQESIGIAVIGGGPGGYVAALRAAQLGATVTLIEKATLGGTCLNVGCIPTKALLHTAEIYDDAKNAAACGVNADVSLDFAQAQAHKAGIVKGLVTGIGGLLAAAKVTVVKGTASFDGPRSLRIETAGGSEVKRFDKIIVAAGSAPLLPPIPGIDAVPCIDSTGALDLTEVPRSMVIIGGGVIGMEIATLYATLGAKVQVVEMLDRILPAMDGELTGIVATALRKKGVDIALGARVVGISTQGDTGVVAGESKAGKIEFRGDKVLVAIGRKANTADLGMDAVGIKHDRGKIVVDDRMETSLPGVYAVGDCNGRIMLAHVASAQGEVAAENAMGRTARFSGATNPSCVYTKPEFAGVGLTEEQAVQAGIPHVIGRFPLSANGKALIMGAANGMIKVIVGKEYREILGVHIVGPRATDLIAEAALAIGLEATTDAVAEVIHAHPTVAEAFREAVLAADGRAIHATPNMARKK